MWAFGGENGGFKLEPADKSEFEMWANLTARMLQNWSIVVWQSDVEMVWRSLKLSPSDLLNRIPQLLSGKATLKTPVGRQGRFQMSIYAAANRKIPLWSLWSEHGVNYQIWLLAKHTYCL